MKGIKSVTRKRSKKRFKTWEAALRDIRKTLRYDYRGLKAAHTRTHWVFIFT